MDFFLLLWVLNIGFGLLYAEDVCDAEHFRICMDQINNFTVEHEHGLFQDENDLVKSCPALKGGMQCLKEYTKTCGKDLVFGNYEEQFLKPNNFINDVCNPETSIRKEYLRASPCLGRNSDDLEICSTKVQEFLSAFVPESAEQEKTVNCMYETIFRGCLMTTAAERCGLETTSFVRKALQYAPNHAWQECFS